MSTLRNFQNEHRGKGVNTEIKIIKTEKNNDNNFKVATVPQPPKTQGSGTKKNPKEG